MRIHLHKYKYIGFCNLESMPNNEKGISVFFKCEKCGKEKRIDYIE